MTSEPQARYYRRALGLFAGYVVVGIVVAVILLLAITDANAGYPSLFFAGAFAAAFAASLAGATKRSASRNRPGSSRPRKRIGDSPAGTRDSRIGREREDGGGKDIERRKV